MRLLLRAQPGLTVIPTSSDDAAGRRHRTAAGRLAAGAVVAIAGLAAITSADPDLWGHVRFGLDILATGTLPSVDPYSFTQDRPWINHEWLSEAVMGLAYRAGGAAGLIWLKAGLLVLFATLMWTALRGADVNARLVALGVVAIAIGSVVRPLRPQLWSLVCFVALLRVLRDKDVSKWWLAPLFVVWTNAHGGWVVGAGVLAVWTTATMWTTRDPGRWALPVIAAAAATLATPYGWHMWQFVWETVGVSRQITEWQPLWTSISPIWLSWLAAAGATVWAMRIRDPNRLARTAALLLLGYLSLRVQRVAPFFVTAAAVLVLPLGSRSTSRAGTLSRSDFLVATALSLALAAAGMTLGLSASRCLAVDDEQDWVPDRRTARTLDAASPGRLVTTFEWGQYAIWHWGPGLKVSMDGRRETVYSDARISQHDDIKAGREAGLSLLATWRPEYVWLPAESRLTRDWLAIHGYRIDAESRRSFVAVRADLPTLTSVDADTSGPRCFPD